MGVGSVVGVAVLSLPLSILGAPPSDEEGSAVPVLPPAEAYPWSGPDMTCVSQGCGDFRLIHFDLGLTDIDRYSIGQRWQVSDRFYLDFQSAVNDAPIDRSRHVDGELIGDGVRVGVSSARWDAHLWSDGSEKGISGELRAKRLRLGLSARQRDADDGVFSSAFVGFRLSSDVEVRAEVGYDFEEEGNLGVGIRPTSSAALGVVWQPGPRAEWLFEARSAQLRPPFGEEIDVDEVRSAGTWAGTRFQVDGRLGFARRESRLESETGEIGAGLLTKLTQRLTLDVGGRFVEDMDLGSQAEGFRASARYYARPFTILRSGRTGLAVEQLVEEAHRLGYNELRTFDEDGLLRLRERLRVADDSAHDLGDLVEQVYRATVAERNVALFGFDWSVDRDQVREDELTEWRGFVALPWPLRPWLSLDLERVEFLRLTYVRRERRVSSGLTRRGSRIEVQAELNRELIAILAWDEPAPTPLELVIGAEAPPRLEASLRYRFRR